MQVQVSEEKVQVPEKKVHFSKKVQVLEAQRESSSRGSLQIQRRLCNPRRALGQRGARVLPHLARRNSGDIGK